MEGQGSSEDPKVKDLSDATVQEMPYHQLQQLAISMQIPGNLKNPTVNNNDTAFSAHHSRLSTSMHTASKGKQSKVIAIAPRRTQQSWQSSAANLSATTSDHPLQGAFAYVNVENYPKKHQQPSLEGPSTSRSTDSNISAYVSGYNAAQKEKRDELDGSQIQSVANDSDSILSDFSRLNETSLQTDLSSYSEQTSQPSPAFGSNSETVDTLPLLPPLTPLPSMVASHLEDFSDNDPSPENSALNSDYLRQVYSSGNGLPSYMDSSPSDQLSVDKMSKHFCLEYDKLMKDIHIDLLQSLIKKEETEGEPADSENSYSKCAQ